MKKIFLLGLFVGCLNAQSYFGKVVKDGYSCIYKKEGYPMQLENLLDRAKQLRVGLWGKNFRAMEALCY